MAIAKRTPQKTPEKRESIFKRAFAETWVQFATTTTIHGEFRKKFYWNPNFTASSGVKHANDQRGNKLSRAFWVVTPIFCFLCACALMATFLMRYKSNPTRINVDTNFGPISEIEFPAVTFCNPNFITDSQVAALVNSLWVQTWTNHQEKVNFKIFHSEIDADVYNITSDEIKKRVKYTAAFTNSIEKFNYSELQLVQDVLLDNRFDVQLTMKKLLFPCTKLLYRCRWEGVIVDCKELFAVSETYQGYCCSFNIQKPLSNTATGKAKKIRKTQYFGYQMGLSVILNPLIEKNAMTSVNSEGIKILVNEYNLYPSARTVERMLPHKQETYVEVRPERTDCSSTVRALPISDRGCVFSNEHELKWV